MWSGAPNFGVGKEPSNSKVLGYWSTSREEMAGSIEMMFGVWGVVAPSNHVLDWGPDPPRGRGNVGVRKGLSCSKVYGT